MAHGRADSDIERLLDDRGFAQAAAESVQALATPSRLRILARLHAGPAAVSEIAESVGMEGSAVSHQLRVLRHLGLVVGRRDGRSVVYELHDDHVAELLDQVVAHVEHVRRGLPGRERHAAAARS
jgi:DNA-binding transcriptional ArsR family regulator